MEQKQSNRTGNDKCIRTEQMLRIVFYAFRWMCVCVCRESHRSSTRLVRDHQNVRYLDCTGSILIYVEV